MLLAYVILFENRISLTEIFHRKNLSGLASSLKKVLPSFLFCGIVLVFISRMGPATWVGGAPSFYHYVITQPYVILRYFTTFFLPIDLSADTDWTTLEDPSGYALFHRNNVSARPVVGCCGLIKERASDAQFLLASSGFSSPCSQPASPRLPRS